ncbi:MAG: hypothetical protein Q4D14_05985 [Bacteroidales bacterium]|nr:hypothetical protein [Bacteroidales bacterium]
MITNQQIVDALKNASLVASLDINALRETVAMYPYFEPVRVLYLKALVEANDVRADEVLKESAVYISNRKWLYNYLFGEYDRLKPVAIEGIAPATGDYFSTTQKTEQDVSLRALAKRLREVRMAKKAQQEQTIIDTNSEANADAQENLTNSVPHIVDCQTEKQNNAVDTQHFIPTENNENTARELIRQKQYLSALKLLRILIAENPEKSVYFAPQIKFLETIVENLNN